MTPYFLIALMLLALACLRVRVRFSVCKGDCLAKPVDGTDPHACESCYRAGKATASRESAERIADLEAELKARDETIATFSGREVEWAKRYACMNDTFKECDDRITRLNAEVEDRDREIASWKSRWAGRDNDAISAGANLVRRDRKIAELEAELKARQETDAEKSAELARTLKEREELRVEADKLGRMNESIEKRLTNRCHFLNEVITDLQGMLANSLDVSAPELGTMLAQRKVTPELFASKLDRVEKRVRDGYSKGYALGQADAFERVRQVFPVDAS